MPQPIKKSIGNIPIKKKKKEKTRAQKFRELREKMKGSQEFGTSKLEERFAREFLDKLGIPYQYQFKATGINRFFDFRVFPELKGPIIEVNGTYWHADPRIYEEKDLNKTQKWDKKIDELKAKWCRRNGIPLIYVWEKDINESPERVLGYLKEVLKPFMDGTNDNKRKRKDIRI